MYQGVRYNLISIQICSVLHKGYTLPSQNITPEAELILTFKPASSSDVNYSALLICLPIYQANFGSVGSDYITQMIKQSIPSCKYDINQGFEYQDDSYQTTPNSTLNACIQSCCDDPNCVAYNFQKGTCSLKRNDKKYKKTDDKMMISGTVKHDAPNPIGSCPKSSAISSKKEEVATLHYLFYSFQPGGLGLQLDPEQTCFSYKTCFELMGSGREATVSSKNMVVFVFPKGITFAPKWMELLKLYLDYQFSPYRLPTEIMGSNAFTVNSFRFDDNGRKIFNKATGTDKGVIYLSKMSSCSEEFQNRFEYFTTPPGFTSGRNNPRITSAPGTFVPSDNTSTQTTQSTPSTTVNGQQSLFYIKMGDGMGNPGTILPITDKTVVSLNEKSSQASNPQKAGFSLNKSITTEEMETIGAGVISVGVLLLGFYQIGKWISK
jgi:hypothetical protein